MPLLSVRQEEQEMEKAWILVKAVRKAIWEKFNKKKKKKILITAFLLLIPVDCGLLTIFC